MNKRIAFLLSLCWVVCCSYAQNSFSKHEVRQTMRRVADWLIAHMKEVTYDPLNWVNATFYLGLSKWASVAEQENQDDFYFKWLRRLGARNYWQVDKRMYHADDICVAQTYLDLYRKYGKEEMLIPTKARTEWVMEHPSKGSFLLDYGDASTLEKWTWCDALFMAPPVYARLYNITGDKKFLRFMDKEYKETYEFLYDKDARLFYRDHRYFTQKEANGEKVFWGRGNGWVLGGLVEILRELPAGNKYRTFYENLFVELATRVATLQQSDGFWRASMLDPHSYSSPETSCSGFFVYALAYGINEGLLSKEEFLPIVEKGWKALVGAVEEDGKLGYVQPIGADPKKVTREMTEVYGPGAFLLAGTEVYRMAKDEIHGNNISAERIREIADMLPEKPEGIGVTYKDRTYWDKMKNTPEARKLIEEAHTSLKDGMPPFVDSLYLHLNKTEIRLPGENMMNARYQYLWRLVLAECLENKRRFIPAICEGVEELCRQKPWSIPAHDRNLHNYHGTDYYVDLVVATAGNTLAQCIYLLDDRLPAETKALAMCAFREKVFRPIYRCLEETKPFYWFTVTNNWNSVCLAGVTGAALALLQDKEERAYFVAAAEKYYVYGMKGYSDDGYCSEGVGYYNYGFCSFILLREEICRATKGKIDFFRTPKFARIAQYGKKIQIMNQVCPAYADCRAGVSPSWFITNYCDNVLGTAPYEEKYEIPGMDNLSLHTIGMFPHQAWKVEMTPEIQEVLKAEADELHSCYDEAGIIISRPATGSTCRLGVSVKGGHNAENHNHNDVGSYAVVMGSQTMAGDMGGPFSYPGDYFSGNAYKYPIKNSFGHPVPFINGQCQVSGKKAQGVVLKKELTGGTDIFQIDYTSAYATAVPELEKLIRTFTYNRAGEGTFVIEDRFEAVSGISFETAITTRADWKMIGNNRLELVLGGEKMTVDIEAPGVVEFDSETVEVNSPAYTRIGIRLKKPLQSGSVRLIMYPSRP